MKYLLHTIIDRPGVPTLSRRHRAALLAITSSKQALRLLPPLVNTIALSLHCLSFSTFICKYKICNSLKKMSLHVGVGVTKYFNGRQSKLWIGRCGPQAWPARSPPDLVL